MKKTFISIFFLIFLAGSGMAQTWSPSGPDDSKLLTGRDSYSPSIAFINNLPYVAYVDESDENNLTVKRYNGQEWVQVGGIISPNADSDIQLAHDAQQTPYITYNDRDEDRVKVKRFDGNSWVDVGSPDFSEEYSEKPLLKIIGNTIYVAYILSDEDEKVRVMKFENNTWTALGTTINMLEDTEDFSFDVTSNGLVYLAYSVNENDVNKAVAFIYNGLDDWTRLPDVAIAQNSYIFDINLATDQNVPYALFKNGDTDQVNLLKYSGGAWIGVDNNGLASYRGDNLVLGFNNAHQPHIAFRDSNEEDKATVIRFNGTSWENVGAAGFTPGDVSEISLTFNGSNPLIAFEDEGNGDRIGAFRFNGSIWESLSGTPGTGGSNSGYPYMTVLNNIPYLSFYNDDEGTIEVKRLINNNWENFGTPSTLRSYSGYHSISSSNGVIFLAYVNSNEQDKINVVYYDTFLSDWMTISPGGITGSENAEDISMAYDTTNDVPYVMFKDTQNSNKATVMRRINNDWETVGFPGFSQGEAEYTNITIYQGKPYITFKDNGNLAVKKLVGFDWVDLGTQVFNPSTANYPTIAIDNDIAYVSYLSDDDVVHLVSKPLYDDNANWENVGSGISGTEANYPSLAIANGVPYIMYEDEDNGSKAMVKYFNGNTWESLGYASSGEISRNRLAVGTNGTLYAAYSSGGIFVKSLEIGTLPVELNHFTASAVNNGVALKWQTSSEINNQYFIIEKSTNGVNFEQLTRVNAGQPTGDNYYFLDANFQSSAYYRLTQVDKNGKNKIYTDKVVFVKGTLATENISVYPNPVTSVVNVKRPIGNTSDLNARVLDLNGRVLLSQSSKTNESISFDLSSFKTGIYLIECTGTGINEIKKIVKK